ncbi:MAG: glyceraldehyde-3-phosphate dehydrogenase [Phaeodactylibacter sp.]|nr:glyceraldehyde-3-phosphate dehydrogenase [Phaeodactylibacter sp.]
MDAKKVLYRDQTDQLLKDWRKQEKKALKLLQVAGSLRFDKSVELIFFRDDVYDQRPSSLINLHRQSGEYTDSPLRVEDSLAIAREIEELEELQPAKIDIGKLGVEWQQEGADYPDLTTFIRTRLAGFTGSNGRNIEPKDVVLYGFGRIGRLAARRIIETTGAGQQLRLKAIVLRPKMKDRLEEVQKRAALLQSDSVHGDFHGTVKAIENGDALLINGNRVQMIFAKDPSEVDYTGYGIKDALLIDNTGVWRDKEALTAHLRPGISQVCLTAPGKGIPNIVHGVNQESLDLEQEPIFCAASCTTNAIVPMLKLLSDKYGVQQGHIETIHAYTSDQNLLDNFHKKPRRGRGAPINMVLTSTGAAKAVEKVLPHLAGKLTGNSVRVPTPNVSLAILNLRLEQPTDVDALNAFLKNESLNGDLVEQIHYSSNTEYVSNDAVGMTTTSVLDAPSTIVSADGHQVTLYLWYDNEYGYTCQVVRLAKYAAKVRRKSYY